MVATLAMPEPPEWRRLRTVAIFSRLSLPETAVLALPVLLAVFAFISAIVADGKGLGFGTGFFAGVLLGPIGLLIVLLVAPRRRSPSAGPAPRPIPTPAEIEAAADARDAIYRQLVLIALPGYALLGGLWVYAHWSTVIGYFGHRAP
jgi:hypothetical protein